jgi:hypothetical protein
MDSTTYIHDLSPQDVKKAKRLVRTLQQPTSGRAHRSYHRTNERSINASITVVKAAYSMLAGHPLPINKRYKGAKSTILLSQSELRQSNIPGTNATASYPPPPPPPDSQF